ncbi:ribose 5-phosphate isomerase A [Fructilactobacillus lindneri]|uniref:Ribokinase n=2 Tax=Fructilactobacillus lindneri TaxID=53444 RepID=A0A0R2JWH0_9LACO|nr:ribokinase [Fructilactobacillus lindneri]ANZ57428.1 ribose 5-phosphate isomerase A [Fructilactobacillus lindneri]ANZ58695.1 ribose 5-phosphate isomerase A [Fructilactobacillus lindneri]KRN80038.1 ribokinase [Fructilactobacillus lindneri DSM 20690 = JCM 11027]POG97913.1 ribose 5-phosphate isomerase A [Fructilactobacillus lindneri]POG99245.1 ribose 5-phosphate isomerase A [Fructilactobacillus lindneri]
MTKKIVVVGSTNVDKVLNVDKYALPGETLAINTYQQSHGGGKGANQAIAAARSGAETTFITKLGNDEDAKMMIAGFKQDKMNVDHLITTQDHETGKAYITVDKTGQNSIYVYGGANMAMTPEDVEAHRDAIANADRIIAQLEIPIPAIIAAFKIAKANGVQTILNPAPARQLPEELLQLTDIITPNETESQTLTGIEVKDEVSMLDNAMIFFEKGIKMVIITVGDKGSFYATPTEHDFIPAFKVKAVDTTAAGDTFIGALASQLAIDNSNIKEAMLYANHASSLTVQVAGAQNSIPTEAEIRNVIKQDSISKEEIEKEKQQAAEFAAQQIPNHITLGLGSGTTSAYFVKAIQKRIVNEKLDIQCVATSLGTQKLAESLHMNMLDVNTIDEVDITVDGADSVDDKLNGIKGGGAALLFEKLVAKMSKKNIWIVDSTKYHKTLEGRQMPVEVIPFGGMGVFRYLRDNGYHPAFRFEDNGDILETDSGNYLINITIPKHADLKDLAKNLKNQTGVVEHGLFLNVCDELIIGGDQIKTIKREDLATK